MLSLYYPNCVFQENEMLVNRVYLVKRMVQRLRKERRCVEARRKGEEG